MLLRIDTVSYKVFLTPPRFIKHRTTTRELGKGGNNTVCPWLDRTKVSQDQSPYPEVRCYLDKITTYETYSLWLVRLKTCQSPITAFVGVKVCEVADT